jgi:hypothetical protein
MAELASLLTPAAAPGEDPIASLGSALGELAAAIHSQTETTELMRADVANLAAVILERG